MTTDNRPAEPASPPLSGPRAPTPPLRQMLRDLPLPPELARELEDTCRKLRLTTHARMRRSVEEELKLQYFYGGKTVAYMETPEGRMIVAEGDLESDVFGQQMDTLTREERRRTTIYSPRPIGDPISEILTP